MRAVTVASLKALGAAGWILAVSGVPSAAEFALPAEGPVAFHRDKLPLDVDAIRGLSRQVETLARGLTVETAQDRRGAAQMLALALALNPENESARRLIAAYAEGGHRAEGDPVQIERSRARIWQIITWLESPGAGSDGQALADCLKDVMVVADPKHPNVAAIKGSGKTGNWAGWIPPLAAYEPRKVPPVENEPTAPSGEGEKPTPDKPPVASLHPGKPGLEKAGLSTLLWRNAGKPDDPHWTLAPGTLEMTAKIQLPEAGGEGQSQGGGEMPDRGLSFRIGPGGESDPFANASRTIQAFLIKRHPSLPAGLRIRVGGPKLDAALLSRRRLSIVAASVVLGDAAITGKEPDGIVLGMINEEGAFTPPPSMWTELRALGKGAGVRLVLPATTAAILPSMLALENPVFFMEHEVLLAENFDQLVEFTAKEPAAPLASAMAKFREIRERMGNQDVRVYLSNTFVKQRLLAVLQEFPQHYSAKALLIQASGNRPTLVARQVLAEELQRALEPMSWLVRIQDHEISASNMSKINALYEQCRVGVAAMERYAEKADLELMERAKEVVEALRGVERASRTRAEYWEVVTAINSARHGLVRRHRAFMDLVYDATGQPRPANGG